VPTEELRDRIERRKRVASQRLRREAWLNAATAAGLGAAGVAFFLRQGPVAARWTDALLSAASDPSVLGQLAVAVLAVALWPVVRVFLPR
jgi:hypothetical protein